MGEGWGEGDNESELRFFHLYPPHLSLSHEGRGQGFIFVASPKISFSVIPAEAGIQSFQRHINTLESGFYRRDDL